MVHYSGDSEGGIAMNSIGPQGAPEGQKKILLIATTADRLQLKDGSPMETGYWAEEVVEPMEIFEGAGFQVDVGTLGGKKPHPDQTSLNPAVVGSPEKADRYRNVIATSAHLNNPLDLEKLDARGLGQYDAIFIAGGHGVLADLANSRKMGELLALSIQNPAQVISSVCHGPAAFKSLELVGGRLPEGVQMTGFSEEEEAIATLKGKVPFELESMLTAMGVAYSQASQPFVSYVVSSALKTQESGGISKFITGENPQSSVEVAKELVSQLKK